MPSTVLFVLGTRPEAIKLCPLIAHLRSAESRFTVRVCVTAQHRELLDQVLELFGVRPDFDLDIMRPGQTLSQASARILNQLEPILQAEKPGMVLVQGDTATTFCGALAAFHQGIAVGHVEAGLRTGDLTQPFPEEGYRLMTSRLAQLHFTPTTAAAANLRKEGISESQISVTGNTGIDALLQVRHRLESGTLAVAPWPWQSQRRLILVTSHRRESFGAGLDQICQALLRLASRPDTQVVYPVHPNPQVSAAVRHWLGAHPQIHLIEPQSYTAFVDLMRRSHLILTDSGGVQEEAPSLGKPVLVLREKTERPEAVEAGTSRLVGTDPERIFAEAALLLDDPAAYALRCAISNPYGDGHACQRIEHELRRYFGEPRPRSKAQGGR